MVMCDVINGHACADKQKLRTRRKRKRTFTISAAFRDLLRYRRRPGARFQSNSGCRRGLQEAHRRTRTTSSTGDFRHERSQQEHRQVASDQRMARNTGNHDKVDNNCYYGDVDRIASVPVTMATSIH